MSGAIFYIFGATGDLAKRKLFPAFYSLYREGKLGDNFAVVGLARRPRTNDQFREDIKQSIEDFARYKLDNDEEWTNFEKRF
jgi:glucose-6-phosphate 1-dehydrogenase